MAAASEACQPSCEMKLVADVRRTQVPQQGRLRRGGSGPVRGQSEADVAHARPAGGLADAHVQRRRASGRAGGRRDGSRGDGHRLVAALAGGQLVREAQRQRRAVGLERRVGPVALILGLEQVAVEGQRDLTAARQRDLQPADRVEQWDVDAVLEPLRRDEPWELAGDGPLRRLAPVARAAQLAPRMQHAESDPVVEHGPSAPAIHGEGDGPAHVAGDRALPGEVRVVTGVTDREAHGEPVTVLL